MKITRLNNVFEEDGQNMLNLSKDVRKSVVGKLKKMLIIELPNGDEVIYPKNMIVEVSSEEEYGQTYGVDEFGEAFSFANRDKSEPNPLTGEIEN